MTPSVMKRCYRYRVEKHALTVWALDRIGTDGADRFEGVVLELKITSPLPDVLRVRVRHHQPAPGGLHGFDMLATEPAPVEISDHGEFLKFTSGRLTVRLARDDWHMEFRDGGSVITSAGVGDLAWMQLEGGKRHLMQRLALGVDEVIYGLGERFGPLVKNGQSIAMWNEDGGADSHLAYKNIPFYLSSRGYGVLVNSTGKVDFEVGTERAARVQFSVPGEELDYFVLCGGSMKETLDLYTQLTGRPALPPTWSFGLWLSTSFTTHYNEATILAMVDEMHRHEIPLQVLHFDCFWMKERQWCDFTWDDGAFPDVPGMLRRLKDRGLKICLWINPYISQLSPLFAEGVAGGFFVRRCDGRVYQRDAWQPGMALVDFTNPLAAAWYCRQLERLLTMGVDAFKTDFGEYIPVKDVQFADGSSPSLMHNYYSYLYNKTVFECLERWCGRGNALVFGRSGTAGIQRFPVSWGGDSESTFESMAASLRGGLSFGMSGGAFWSHDIGGFSGNLDATLYKRWIAFGLLSSHSRLHGSGSYRVPWLFDEQAVEVLRHFTLLKLQLMPYLVSLAHEAELHGWPVLRAMALEFPDDLNCRHLDRQYMLGNSLLVAPVFNHGGIAEYYLPSGSWSDLLTGQSIAGGAWQREAVDFMRLPLFLRQEALLPLADTGQGGLVEGSDLRTLRIASPRDGCVASHMAFLEGRAEPVQFTLTRKDSVVTLLASADVGPLRLQIGGLGRVAVKSNATCAGLREHWREFEWPDSAKPMHLLILEDTHQDQRALEVRR
ncbi:MAG: alpha-xylosidase [Phycisphaerales bacterium]|nr:alpha-xylosidase [Phycisphaerales bacterium]